MLSFDFIAYVCAIYGGVIKRVGSRIARGGVRPTVMQVRAIDLQHGTGAKATIPSKAF
jgi:hypothetical protein